MIKCHLIIVASFVFRTHATAKTATNHAAVARVLLSFQKLLLSVLLLLVLLLQNVKLSPWCLYIDY